MSTGQFVAGQPPPPPPLMGGVRFTANRGHCQCGMVSQVNGSRTICKINDSLTFANHLGQ